MHDLHLEMHLEIQSVHMDLRSVHMTPVLPGPELSPICDQGLFVLFDYLC